MFIEIELEFVDSLILSAFFLLHSQSKINFKL